MEKYSLEQVKTMFMALDSWHRMNFEHAWVENTDYYIDQREGAVEIFLPEIPTVADICKAAEKSGIDTGDVKCVADTWCNVMIRISNVELKK